MSQTKCNQKVYHMITVFLALQATVAIVFIGYHVWLSQWKWVQVTGMVPQNVVPTRRRLVTWTYEGRDYKGWKRVPFGAKTVTLYIRSDAPSTALTYHPTMTHAVLIALFMLSSLTLMYFAYSHWA